MKTSTMLIYVAIIALVISLGYYFLIYKNDYICCGDSGVCKLQKKSQPCTMYCKPSQCSSSYSQDHTNDQCCRMVDTGGCGWLKKNEYCATPCPREKCENPSSVYSCGL